MKPVRFLPALTLIAALFVALVGVASAAQMAPVGAHAPAYQAHVAAGGFDSLCATTDLAHADHDCPFCRLLADPDHPAPTPAIWQLDPLTNVQALRDLMVRSQLRQHGMQARGPPCAV